MDSGPDSPSLSDASSMLSGLSRMWEPPAFEFPDQWADANRIMPPGSPFPGKWSTDRTPYLRAPMRAFADPQYDVVVFMCRRQRGKTEIGANCLGWMWDTCPAPSLWITPTESLARSFAGDRVKAMFATIEGLAERTHEKREGALEKFVDGVRFGLGWAGSRTQTASHPAKFAVIDERSRMTENIGGEGDPVRIVQEGGGMFPGATSLVISSPTEEEVCPTTDWWLQGTRMRWSWACPSCGEWFVPCLANARYPEGASYATIRAEACIVCPACEREIRDDEKADVEADYQPCIVDEDGGIQLRPGLEVRNSVASYWTTGLADQITHIGEAMEKYARAARTAKPADLQAVVNTTLGELWKLKGERVQASELDECKVAAIPDEEIQLVTIGVDVQEDCIYYVARGWGFLATSWWLAAGRVLGATDQPEVWDELALELDTTFCGRRPRMVLVDSGHQTAMVYQQCRKRSTWAPARGRDVLARPYHDTLVDESVSGRALKNLRLWIHDVDHWQGWLNSRIRWTPGEPGAWYIPADIDELVPDYCAQVVNQTCYVQRGKRHWTATGDGHDHYRDCELLAAIAGDMCGARRLRPSVPRETSEEIGAQPPPPQESAAQRMQRRRARPML